MIRIGIGGWNFAPWRGSFYPQGLPQKRELEYASTHLSSIEVNGTFYRSQKPETFANWRDETPDGFVFALKGPRYATNRRELATAGDSIDRFLASGLVELGDKLGPINWQFGPYKRFESEDFEGFLKLLPATLAGRPLRHAVEVRHASFASPEFVTLARAYGVAIVLAGDADYPQIADPTAPFVYARIMGTTPDTPLGYPGPALEAWAARIRALAEGRTPTDLQTLGVSAEVTPRDVFLYVISGHKERNPAAAQALIERLGTPSRDLPRP